MSPRSCSGGPKSSPRGPKTAPRAARSAPRGAQEQPGAHQKGPKRGPGRPRSAKRPFGRPPGPILPSFWGALGFIFKQLRRPFRSSRALRQTIENTLRNYWSKGLLSVWPAFGGRKRNHDEGVHAFSGQDFLVYESNWPPRRVFHTSDLTNPRFLRGSVLSTPFFVHPLLPEARDHTKMLFEITCQKVLQDSCGTEAHKDHGSVAGLRGRSHLMDPATEHCETGSRLAVAERVGLG